MNDVEELERALEYPWEKWTVFLHPAQRQLVERDYGGPARVAGSAGTGKTIVALHRAVYLTRENPESRVLLTTFSETLANALHGKLRRLIGNQPRLGERLDIHAMDAIGQRLYTLHFGRPQLASREMIQEMLTEEAARLDEQRFSPHFLRTEWEQIVDAWQLANWEEYREVPRLGRKTRLPERQRQVLWEIFSRLRSRLQDAGMLTMAGIFNRLAARLGELARPPFDFCVVDEAQDITVPQLRFLAALGGGRPNSLFFAGDLGQRIFQPPFSWKGLGVDIRGRSRTLKINYRTSHQIRTQADRLLAPEIADVDGVLEERRGTISVFNGPPPTIITLPNPEAESEAVGQWLAERVAEGIAPHELGVFVRSTAELARAEAALKRAGVAAKLLDDLVETEVGLASYGIMHLAKGLEFRAVAVMACDDEVMPLQSRIEAISDHADLEEVYNTERHLLYVACTRARDHLLVSSGGEPSEFLDDLRA